MGCSNTKTIVVEPDTITNKTVSNKLNEEAGFGKHEFDQAALSRTSKRRSISLGAPPP